MSMSDPQIIIKDQFGFIQILQTSPIPQTSFLVGTLALFTARPIKIYIYILVNYIDFWSNINLILYPLFETWQTKVPYLLL